MEPRLKNRCVYFICMKIVEYLSSSSFPFTRNQNPHATQVYLRLNVWVNTKFMLLILSFTLIGRV